ncbi:MAG: type II toxin-antitoxin system VapC family toxin [Alphaproteobacteria bacterium]|nr:type II toxin-antitoxin system VapC family toxin [Alphaproteobacteria bacterium]
MTGFVLDCSIAMTWCFEDEATPATDALLDRVRDEGAIVPMLWHLEIGNVLLQAERRGRVSSADLSARLELLAALPITTDDQTSSRALREVLSLARAETLTTYDAAYLELAVRRRLPVATKDRPLQRAAKRVGIDVI